MSGIKHNCKTCGTKASACMRDEGRRNMPRMADAIADYFKIVPLISLARFRLDIVVPPFPLPKGAIYITSIRDDGKKDIVRIA